MSRNPIHSTLVCNPDYAELIKEFVTEIPSRMGAIRKSIQDQDSKQLRVLIHQLRGACGSYGFHPITPLAAAIEEKMKSGASLDLMKDALEEFISVCLTMTADPA